MKTIKLYRINRSGQLQGFERTLDAAESYGPVGPDERIEYKKTLGHKMEDLVRITEFEVPRHRMQGVDISDTEKVLREKIWGDGEITNEWYYLDPDD